MAFRLVASASRRTFLKGAAAVAMTVPAFGRAAKAAGKVSVYNWDTYIGETTLADFTKATGIEVTYDLYADNAELFAKLKAGNPGYDVVVPTHDWAERMILAGMLSPLDKTRLPNLANIDPAFADAPFDPGRKHTVPYFWGTIGIGYRKSKVKTPPDSWAALFDNPAMKRRISILSEPSTLVQMALKFLGHSLNTTDPATIGKAEELLVKAKPLFKTIAGDNGQELLASGEVDLAMEWNGDVLQVMEEDEDLAFALPKEGGLIWQDNLAIAKGGPNPAGAHAYIDFVLQADTHAGIARAVNYALPNAKAKALMDEDYRANPAIFPPAASLKNSETSKYLGEDVAKLYEKAIARLRAA